jgi:hypothetical protein
MLLLLAAAILQFPIFAQNVSGGPRWTFVKSFSSPTNSSEAVLDAPVPSIPTRLAPQPTPVAGMLLPTPVASTTISSLPIERQSELHARRMWLGLSIAAHGGAIFDAWSTRRVISAGGEELNPMVRPFVRNASIYVATQVGPTIWDYLGRRMEKSRHLWIRDCWWLPQTLNAAMSVAAGVHNLSALALKTGPAN